MPITDLSFRKPTDWYCAVEPSFAGGPDMSPFILEMDVDDYYEVSSLLDIQGEGTIKDVTFSFPEGKDMYAKIDENGRLTALKQTKGVNKISSNLPNKLSKIIEDSVLLTARSKNSAASYSIYVRIYDKPTSIQIVRTTKDLDSEFFTDAPFDSKLLTTTGLEVKPGGSFEINFKVLPETALQAVRLMSNSNYMRDNIKSMTVKDDPGEKSGTTKFTVAKNASYYAGNPGWKDSNNYGTYVTSKRHDNSKPKTEVQLQIVQFCAEEPKPLDYLSTFIPGGFKHSIGGRIGTIDGGLRIMKDAHGRSLIKDTYKDIFKGYSSAALAKAGPIAIVVDMADKGYWPVNHGIDFTYYWDELHEMGVSYEPDGVEEKSKYRKTHLYAMAIHSYGQRVMWSECHHGNVISSRYEWRYADKLFGKCTCHEEDGFKLTAHYHQYNNAGPDNEDVIPVRLLYEFQTRYPALKYISSSDPGAVIDSLGHDSVSFWYLPSRKEMLKLNMNHYQGMKKALEARVNFMGGNLESPSYLWTSCLNKDIPDGDIDYEKALYARWIADKGVSIWITPKRAEHDFRPFIRV
ncbi:MAG: hypothetical protein J5490_00300 [Bacteroidales bacterium]|nr:hypothetical protein [Bacteroidales bacterium]